MYLINNKQRSFAWSDFHLFSDFQSVFEKPPKLQHFPSTLPRVIESLLKGTFFKLKHHQKEVGLLVAQKAVYHLNRDDEEQWARVRIYPRAALRDMIHVFSHGTKVSSPIYP